MRYRFDYTLLAWFLHLQALAFGSGSLGIRVVKSKKYNSFQGRFANRALQDGGWGFRLLANRAKKMVDADSDCSRTAPLREVG